MFDFSQEQNLSNHFEPTHSMLNPNPQMMTNHSRTTGRSPSTNPQTVSNLIYRRTSPPSNTDDINVFFSSNNVDSKKL